MKSEPDVFGIDHLKAEGSTLWDGIRNYQARNFMREMQVGDRAFFYHSNAKPPGIVGLMEVVETGITDPSQFEPSNKYFDPASKPEAPRWDCARLKYLGVFAQQLSHGLRLLYGYQLSRYHLTEISHPRFVRELTLPIRTTDLLNDQLRGEVFYHLQNRGYWHSDQ